MNELIVTGGTIHVMDDAYSRSEGMLVRDNKIVATGALENLIRKAATADPQVLDLRGRAVVPGFNDCHLHTNSLGETEGSPSLLGLNKTEIIAVLEDLNARLPDGEVLVAANWDYPSCPDPHKADLDAHFPNRPVMLMQFSGHGAWVNTAMLELLKIDRNTPDWNLGGAKKDARGELTGLIDEPGNAPGIKKLYLGRLRDKPRVTANFTRAFGLLSEHGITSAQDNTWFPGHLDVIRQAHRDGDQTVRMSCWSPGFIKPFDILFGLKQFDGDWYAKGPRKFFLDGALSSHTAYMSEPYCDDPSSSGSGLPSETIYQFLKKATKQRRQIACHSIGDESTHLYIDAMERVARDYPHATSLRHRIEHAQLLKHGDVERIAELGMVVSVQPHASATPDKDRKILGVERFNRAYPVRSLIDAGVPVAFGSDYPGEATYDPMYGIHLAVNKDTIEAVSAEEALYAYTAGSAFAEFREHDKGRLLPGFLADFAVLSADPTEVAKEVIRDIVVDATFVDGKSVYNRDGSQLEPQPLETHRRRVEEKRRKADVVLV